LPLPADFGFLKIRLLKKIYLSGVGFGRLIRLTVEAWGKFDFTLEVSRKSGSFPASNSLNKSSINLFPGMDFFSSRHEFQSSLSLNEGAAVCAGFYPVHRLSGLFIDK